MILLTCDIHGDIIRIKRIIDETLLKKWDYLLIGADWGLLFTGERYEKENLDKLNSFRGLYWLC